MSLVTVIILASLVYAVSAGTSYAWQYRHRMYQHEVGARVWIAFVWGFFPPLVLGLWIGTLLTQDRSVKGRLGSR